MLAGLHLLEPALAWKGPTQPELRERQMGALGSSSSPKPLLETQAWRAVNRKKVTFHSFWLYVVPFPLGVDVPCDFPVVTERVFCDCVTKITDYTCLHRRLNLLRRLPWQAPEGGLWLSSRKHRLQFDSCPQPCKVGQEPFLGQAWT